MRDPVDRYLEAVLVHADLAPRDEKIVRSELADHLATLISSAQSSKPTETFAMLNDQFGKPSKIGKQIAIAKGRCRTWVKKQLHKLPLRMAIALVLAFSVRFAVVEAFVATGDGATPMIPRGSRVLVYKLAGTYSPGDIIVFHDKSGTSLLGVVKSNDAAGTLTVARTNQPDRSVSRDEIVGKVVLNTR